MNICDTECYKHNIIIRGTVQKSVMLRD